MLFLTFFFIAITTTIIVLYLIERYKLSRNANNAKKQYRSYRLLIEDRVSFYKRLDATNKNRFLTEVSAFLSSVKIEGVGTNVDDLDRILVASSAIIPIFSFQGWRYPNLTNVILYPDAFDKHFQFEGTHHNTLGLIGTGYMNGQMLLSKKALHSGFSTFSKNSNTAIHEFVHLIDKSDGSVDGVPEHLLENVYVIPWIKLMHREMQAIAKGNSEIDSYALTNEAEFFAVASEYFFENPDRLNKKHPALFEMLTKIFKTTS
ncbi:zinc-dependent peptidase [Olivibacter sp. SDN3]|uniref:M90 family metallopeptidase n=1 Tax=Olivibacter sp. SDN3 TaxID=2764720 RepID=UPI0016512673|nr:M90 family metallopeptidase [Olivibacter sp. SDN3]QNL48901.1 zinc-dependent peptidase [Olivibacter sp. SDN3]